MIKIFIFKHVTNSEYMVQPIVEFRNFCVTPIHQMVVLEDMLFKEDISV